ncbi:hypothetical protein Y032_0013g1954 [Ancylostoma ceylanicum]|uniref:Uncharacterized protein n=1 Tax=Ancylostoma ceylanicum TaxID=53326 RepID=A0A016VAW5_9BILA|nr:hypothetical protein Y032_0013g1954 [Ancylostoma ceylanicum]
MCLHALSPLLNLLEPYIDLKQQRADEINPQNSAVTCSTLRCLWNSKDDNRMVYIDSSGNVCESKGSIFSYILSFFQFFILFFKSLFGLRDSTGPDANENRDHLRRSNTGGGGRWPGSGGPGGPGRNGGFRRNIGGLPRGSGMTCPPMAAKSLGCAQTESGVCLNNGASSSSLVPAGVAVRAV